MTASIPLRERFVFIVTCEQCVCLFFLHRQTEASQFKVADFSFNPFRLKLIFSDRKADLQQSSRFATPALKGLRASVEISTRCDVDRCDFSPDKLHYAQQTRLAFGMSLISPKGI